MQWKKKRWASLGCHAVTHTEVVVVRGANLNDALLICKLEKEEGIYGMGPRDMKVTSVAKKPLD